jgi:DNA-binding NtrC family response regulator
MNGQKRQTHQTNSLNRRPEGSVIEASGSVAMVGISGSFMAMVDQIRQAAAWDSEPVLLIGERGSGKEIAARALHQMSGRRVRRFVPILVSALCENLLADELFGHKRDSFTGAHRARPGKFAGAGGGTAFLDEIGDLSSAAQVALLRVLETGEIAAIGEDLPHKVDVRIVAASNQDLRHLIRRGRFRADLYDRLRVFEIRVPPLRDRRDDIMPLAAHFLKECCAKTGCAMGKLDFSRCAKETKVDCASEEFYEGLCSYDWPGNVRELRSFIIRLRAAHPHSLFDIRLLQMNSPSYRALNDPRVNLSGEDVSLKAAVRCHIESVLDDTNYNLSDTARRLQIPRATLYEKMKRLGIDKRGK